jgi:hypothetical protein
MSHRTSCTRLNGATFQKSAIFNRDVTALFRFKEYRVVKQVHNSLTVILIFSGIYFLLLIWEELLAEMEIWNDRPTFAGRALGPCIYSFEATAQEQNIAVHFLLFEKPSGQISARRAAIVSQSTLVQVLGFYLKISHGTSLPHSLSYRYRTLLDGR